MSYKGKQEWPRTTSVGILIGVLIALAIVIAVVALVRLDTTGKKGSGLGKEYLYEIDAKIDPNLIIYEQLGEVFSTGLKAPTAIAVGPGERVYVAGDEVIRIFNEGPNSIFSSFGQIELTDAPRCLTVADDGKFYIGTKDHVEVYDNQGKQLASWDSLGDDAVLTSIAVSKNDVFVADAGNRIVLRYDTAGKLINRIGAKDKARNIPGFVIPSPYFDLAVGRDGLLRVVNPGRHRIEAYTFEGDLEFFWGKFSNVDVKGFCGCCNPANFAILDDESFVTCEKGLTRVKIYDAEGTFVGVVAGPEQLIEGGTERICYFPDQCQAGGFDVAVDAAGRIFVLDTIKNVVRIFTKIKRG
ncbi:MAG: NHL repeat-containing protein [Planctomycetota bacterium]